MKRPDEHSDHRVKRVQLPSGKTIEVVYFADADADPTAESIREIDRPQTEARLHVCRDCESELVYPTAWEEDSRESWRVTLRCPECESIRSGVFDQLSIEAFDDILDSGSDSLAADYRKLMRANLGDEIERFAEALAADAILPEDF